LQRRAAVADRALQPFFFCAGGADYALFMAVIDIFFFNGEGAE
jgi:hypothetical protein